MSFKTRFHSNTLGVDAQVFVSKAVAYTAQADLKSFAANAVEGEIAVINDATNAVISGAIVNGTDVFIALKRDGAVERSVTFTYLTGGVTGEKISYSAPVKHAINFTSLLGTQAVKVVQDITYTAVPAGTIGNSYQITYVVNAGAGASTTVAVVGTSITVTLGTAGAGVSNATATQVQAAIAASAAASALVTAVITGTAATVQVAAAVQNLAGATAEYAPTAGGGDYMEITLVETTPGMMPLPTYQYGISLKNGETYSQGIARLVALINNAQAIENQSRTLLVSAAVVTGNSISLTALRNYEHFTIATRGILTTTGTWAVTSQFAIGSGVGDQVALAEKAGDVRKGVTTNYPYDTNALPSEFGAPTQFADASGATQYRSWKFKFTKQDRLGNLDLANRTSYIFLFAPSNGTNPDAALATIFGL